jgi:dTDP-4-dehydrorhamnose reductase
MTKHRVYDFCPSVSLTAEEAATITPLLEDPPQLHPHSGPTLIFGSRGYLGELWHRAHPQAIAEDADITDPQAVARALDRHSPAVVINFAGKTGRPNIDWCESHREETFRVNVLGALNVAQQCRRRGILLVHPSSGCIYQGHPDEPGFSEEDPPNYLGSWYSRTKAIADQILGQREVLVLRLRMPFDSSTSERNLLVKLRRYAKVLDVPNSLTWLPDFFQAMDTLIERREVGIWNVVNPGAISPYAIMCRYRERIDPQHQFQRLTLENLGQVVATGRSNCVLDTAKLANAGVRMLPIAEAIDRAMAEAA